MGLVRSFSAFCILVAVYILARAFAARDIVGYLTYRCVGVLAHRLCRLIDDIEQILGLAQIRSVLLVWIRNVGIKSVLDRLFALFLSIWLVKRYIYRTLTFAADINRNINTVCAMQLGAPFWLCLRALRLGS